MCSICVNIYVFFCTLLGCTSFCVLQEVQQDEARAETETAPGSLFLRNIIQNDVAVTKKSQTLFMSFWCLFF